MINLIPPAARKNVIREYWLRVISVWLFLLGTGCMIVAVLLLPSYMLVHNQIITLGEQVTAGAEKNTTFDTSALALKKAGEQAALLMQGASTTPFSQYLLKLETLAGSGIGLYDISYTKVPQPAITISGTADTRENLAGFRDALEANPAFSDVNLPISALIKDRDLLFSMSLKVSTTTL